MPIELGSCSKTQSQNTLDIMSSLISPPQELQMDQQTKKHLQEEFDAALEEKDQMITVLQTQVCVILYCPFSMLTEVILKLFVFRCLS